jgi:hypothetical protein
MAGPVFQSPIANLVQKISGDLQKIEVKTFVESFVRLCDAAPMARPLRLEYPGAVYHVMNRGLARRATFRTPAEYATFLQVLGETWTLLGGRGLRLLSDGPSLPSVSAHARGESGACHATSQWGLHPTVYRAHRRDGPLFRGGVP